MISQWDCEDSSVSPAFLQILLSAFHYGEKDTKSLADKNVRVI